MLPIAYTQPDRRSAAPLRTERIAEARDFAALGDEWNELLRDSDSSNVFLTWEWLHAWWTRFGGHSGLNIVLVRAGDELVAAAPLLRTRAALPWLTRLEFLGTGLAGSDYLDLIVRRGYEETCLPRLEDAIVSSGDNLPPPPGARSRSRKVPPSTYCITR